MYSFEVLNGCLERGIKNDGSFENSQNIGDSVKNVARRRPFSRFVSTLCSGTIECLADGMYICVFALANPCFLFRGFSSSFAGLLLAWEYIRLL